MGRAAVRLDSLFRSSAHISFVVWVLPPVKMSAAEWYKATLLLFIVSWLSLIHLSMGSSILSGIASTEGFLASLLLFSVYVIYGSFSRSRYNFPPGPRGLPIIGNVLQIPSEDQMKVFTEWGEKYGS